MQIRLSVVASTLVVITTYFTSCRPADVKTEVLTHYKGDSLKSKATTFLLRNMHTHYALISHYIDQQGYDHTDFVSTYKGALLQNEVTDSLGVTRVDQKVYDTTTITTERLIGNIDQAFDTYYNPINTNTRYSFDVFLNYILPYRIGLEEVNDWRDYNRTRYQHYLHTFQYQHLSVQELYDIIIKELEGSNVYAYSRRPHVSRPAFHKTMRQVLDVRVPFNCEDNTIQALYALRAIGIPAAYEKIPLWGKFNYGHAQETVLFENGKFYPAVGGDTAQFKYQIAKMYRRTFATQPNPYNEIRACGERPENIPDYFNYTNLIDITGERTDVSDISVNNLPISHAKVVYLCIFNAGLWKPVAWARYDESHKSALFRNMGRKILYQMMYRDRGETRFVEAPFILDTSGETVPLRFGNTNGEQTVTKYDRNKYIVNDQVYVVYYWSPEKFEWIKVKRFKASNAAITFETTPAQALYKIEPVQRDDAEPVRPFTLTDKQQIWW